tara:strand:- start:284 stop:460 length:177 start_codon:yes stop_codon:yes gene_type:complete
MKKYSKIEFVKNNKEYIHKVFSKILNFIEENDGIYLRSDQESFRMDIINYLYNIYLNE